MAWQGIAHNKDENPGRRLLRLPVCAVVAVGMSVVVSGAFAQPSCELSLQQADSLFVQGRFGAAREAIEQCLQGQPLRAERRQAYTLLARIHLALDEIDAAEQVVKKLLDTDPEYEPELFAAPRFKRMVEEVKSGTTVPIVTSVSKSKESLMEAPATVVVVTAEQIERRGYLDLEQVLHDLPGFDFSRYYGVSYANIYQRGYRSIETNRTLVLVDGVEQNELFASVVFLSRQFSLSNIERIEVVYGPASTMYGANAFAGVINIITKDPMAYIEEGNHIGYDARLTGGSYSTRSIDATVAGKTTSSSLSWSLTARKYEADDFDLSGYDDWDYDPAYYDTVDYQSLSKLNVTDPAQVQAILNQYTNEQVTRYFDIQTDGAGQPVGLALSAAGAARARGLDQGLFSQIIGGNPVRYNHPTDDWLVNGKLQSSNLVVGMQLWSRLEAASTAITDRNALTGENGFNWKPEHTTLFMKYSRQYLDDRLSFSWFTRYKRHDLNGANSSYVWIRNFARGDLGATDLLDEKEPFTAVSYYYRSNNQLRSEVNLFYEHSDKLNIVGGFEARFSSIGAQNVSSSTPPAGETGASPTGVLGGNQISSTDMGLFVQASYRPLKPLKLVAGGRLDNNKIRDTGGFGTVFNPRLAAIYRYRDLVFKAVYAEAFQDAPNFQKYETTPARQLPNPNLAPEEVNNLEFSVGWSLREDLTLGLSVYQANYQGIVEEVTGVPCALPSCTSGTTNQYQNTGSLDIKGAQVEAAWTPKRFQLSANYTYTDSYNPDMGLPVGDIASHRFNLQGRTLLHDKLDLSLRLNWVIGRDTGPGTTVGTNPYSSIDDYLVAHAAVSYRDLLPGIDLQLVVQNLFDTEYFDPGTRVADGGFFAARIPQPQRAFFLRLKLAR